MSVVLFTLPLFDSYTSTSDNMLISMMNLLEEFHLLLFQV